MQATVEDISSRITLAPLLDILARIERGEIKPKVLLYAHNFSGYDAFHCLPTWVKHVEDTNGTVSVVLHAGRVYALDMI